MTQTDTNPREEAIKFALSAYTSENSRLMQCDLDDAAADIIADLKRAGFAIVESDATVLELIAEVERLRAEKRDGLPSKEEFYATAREAAESAKHLHLGRFKTPYRGGE